MPVTNGDEANNNLVGSADDDTINGFGGNDHIVGNGGNDTIDGGSGDDVAAGGAGRDTVIGGGGYDIVFGGEENPDLATLYADHELQMKEQYFNQRPPNPFAVTLPADSDPDTLSSSWVVVAGYGDTVQGVPAFEHVTYLGAPQGITWTAAFSPAPFITGGGNVSWVQGSNFADTFANLKYVLAMGGDDHITTTTSEFQVPYVDGGDGNDTIEILTDGLDQYGFPTVLGGAGDDTIIEGHTGEWANRTGYLYVDGGAGNDTIYGGGTGGAGNDLIDATGYAGTHLIGGTGADTLIGGSGDDLLFGDRENGFDNFTEVDHISAGAGNDFIYSGYGDIVDGGDGFDTVAVSYVGATHGITGDTRDLHQGLSLADGAGTFQNVERFSDIALTSFNDKMVIGDQADPAVVRSWDGDDYLIGQLVSVTMYGGNGNDTLVGSTSNDVLYGEAGDDKIMGYFGSDELWGGSGADRFFFTEIGATDKIGDFETGVDKIDLSAIDANTAVAGDQAFSFVGSAGFSGHAGELRVYDAGGSAGMYAAVDVNGDGAADLSIQLGTAKPVVGDFIL